MPQDEKVIERKSGRERDLQVEEGRETGDDVHEAMSGLLKAAADRVVVVAEPQPFRFFGTRIQEAVRVIKG